MVVAEETKQAIRPSISMISSRSSTTNSLANFDSSYNCYPFVRNLNKQKGTIHRFRADLSDRVSIPNRGTSSGSYGKRE